MDEETLPVEIEEPCEQFHLCLGEVERLANLWCNNESSEDLSDLSEASLAVTTSYALTSLYWMYLTLKGVDVKDHPVKQELGRIQKIMQRITDVSVRSAGKEDTRTIKVDPSAAKRIVTSALWDLEEKKINETSLEDDVER